MLNERPLTCRYSLYIEKKNDTTLLDVTLPSPVVDSPSEVLPNASPAPILDRATMTPWEPLSWIRLGDVIGAKERPILLG